MGRYVFLLRGINVGGRNKVPMAALRGALGEVGFTDVATYLQSGNIVASVEAERAEAVSLVRSVVAERFEVDVPVMARSAAELEAVVAANPFPEAVANPKLLHVGFCEPAASSTDGLDPERFAPDRFALAGGELYLDYDAAVHSSKLTNAVIERALGVTVTARNWNTVTRLVELASEAAT